MAYEKEYFNSGKEFNQKRGLYFFRNFLPKEIVKRNSEKHHFLMLTDKWKFFSECKTVLDAGCGKGEFMRAAPANAEVSGADINKKEICKLQKEGFNAKTADISKKIPFEDEKFDGVYCSHVLEHIENPDKMLSEIKRVLKKEGIIVLCVPNFSFKRFYSDPTHKRPYPKEALFRILRDNGFKDIQIKRGLCLNQAVSAVFLLFPRLRLFFEKALSPLCSWEHIAIAKN